nr:unnamed protein product [Callosobruchus analis]
MSLNRLQKLLFSEYCDFDDMVLIESPFAQTTKDGRGIRQVHLGLTPSKLVLATDVLPPVEYVNVKYTPGIDPDIETFELIAIYPVECVNLSVYKRKRTQALKARFCNNKVLYFELGGFEKRAMFWNLWCERVKFLCPGDSGSSRSETSVATSTTGSTLYLMDKRVVSSNGVKQLWYKFGFNSVFNNGRLPPSIESSQVTRWTDRHLYLGNGFNGSKDYMPVMNPPSKAEFVKSMKNSTSTMKPKMSRQLSYAEENNLSYGDSVQINRFGSGVYEGCRTALYLTVDDYRLPQRYSQVGGDSVTPSISDTASFDIEAAAESALLVWEFYNCTDPNKYLIRHKRR